MATDRKPTCIACAGAGGGISEEEVKALIDASEAELLDLGWEKVTVPTSGKKNTILNLINDDYDVMIKLSSPEAIGVFTKESLVGTASNYIYCIANTYNFYGDRFVALIGVGSSSFVYKYVDFSKSSVIFNLKLYALDGSLISASDISTYIVKNDSTYECIKPFIVSISYSTSVMGSCLIMPGILPSKIHVNISSSINTTVDFYDRHTRVNTAEIYNYGSTCNGNLETIQTSENTPTQAWFSVYKRKRLVPYKEISQ